MLVYIANPMIYADIVKRDQQSFLGWALTGNYKIVGCDPMLLIDKLTYCGGTGNGEYGFHHYVVCLHGEDCILVDKEHIRDYSPEE